MPKRFSTIVHMYENKCRLFGCFYFFEGSFYLNSAGRIIYSTDVAHMIHGHSA